MSITLDGNNLGTVGNINSATAQNTTSGTSFAFTGIPAGVKRVTIMFDSIVVGSGSGTPPKFQLGTSGGYITSGYVCSMAYQINNNYWANSDTSGFVISPPAPFGTGVTVNSTATLTNVTANTWIFSGIHGYSSGSNSPGCGNANGYVSLSGALTSIKLLAQNGTDGFTNGAINILYE